MRLEVLSMNKEVRKKGSFQFADAGKGPCREGGSPYLFLTGEDRAAFLEAKRRVMPAKAAVPMMMRETVMRVFSFRS